MNIERRTLNIEHNETVDTKCPKANYPRSDATRDRTLIVTGAAPCVREDIAAFLSLRGGSQTPWQSYDFMAIGLDAVDKYDWNVKYFATYHPSEILEAKERRAAKGGNTDYKVIAHVQHEGLVDMIVPFDPPSGSSSLLGVLAGIQMGYEKIIVCGCPLAGKNDKGYDYANFRDGWKAKYDEIKAFARSMSGWTRELLGSPDEAWIKQI